MLRYKSVNGIWRPISRRFSRGVWTGSAPSTRDSSRGARPFPPRCPEGDVVRRCGRESPSRSGPLFPGVIFSRSRRRERRSARRFLPTGPCKGDPGGNCREERGRLIRGLDDLCRPSSFRHDEGCFCDSFSQSSGTKILLYVIDPVAAPSFEAAPL